MPTPLQGMERVSNTTQAHPLQTTRTNGRVLASWQISYITGVTVIPYPGYGCIITLVTNRDHTYLILSIIDFLQYSCRNFIKMNAGSFRRNGKWVYCKHVYYMFWYLFKVDYTIKTFIHAPNFSFKEVMRIL
jgi:hypothetical protein